MIIDKIKPYWTDEDRQKRRAIREELDTLMAFKTTEQGKIEIDEEAFDKWEALLNEWGDIKAEVENRYIESHSKKELMADIKEIVNAFEKEDYLKTVKDMLSYIAEKDNDFPTLEAIKQLSIESSQNCYKYILEHIRVQLDGLAEDEDLKEEALNIVKKRVAIWYAEPIKEEPNKPLFTEESVSLQFRYPKNHLQNLTKASSKIFDSKIPLTDLQQLEFDVSPQKSKLDTTYSVYVDMTAKELKGTENITEFDESIFNSVISVAQANEHGFFTPKQIATHLLYGDNPSNSNPSPQRVGAVTKSIEKQRHIDITIDWTEHARLNKQIPEGATFKIKNYMLPVKEFTATMNGQKVHGYQLLDVPPLYQYASSVGQIATHPAKMLNVPANLDEQKIVIRDFLLKEIGHMKNNPSWNRTISLIRILDIAGADSDTISRKKRSQIISFIKDILDYWKSQQYIKGYIENKRGVGNAVRSYTIKP